MPRYQMEGVGFDGDDQFFNTSLTLQTDPGVTTLRYDYNILGYLDLDIEGDFSLSYRGAPLDRGANIGFTDLVWGAGLRTKLIFIDFGPGFGSFIAPVAGSAIPPLTADNGHVFEEFIALTGVVGTESGVTTGPYATGKEVALRDLFSDDTGGSVVRGGQGNDTLQGTGKKDLIVGQRGADVAFGKKAADTMLMGRGDDTAYGGASDDVISGYAGDDQLYGGTGRDVLFGFADADMLFGQRGTDQLFGGDDTDRLYGGNGTDRLTGGAGDDALFGQGGVDRLFGGDGDDRLKGGRGDDLLYGGNDADSFVFGKGDGADRIVDFRTGADRLLLDDTLWDGTLSAQDIVDDFAKKAEGTITLTFDDGDTLSLLQFGNKGNLVDLIDII